ncbi:unnamed protein product [Nippostrongylus brasiliensis]|uniref:VATC domain-containing protein n=1 Tax=Nippostrongylus brasiliensis TaxID=27835 RepID=A0A0N4XVU3_NIPBR|nr:unnamed protein product [Nippostrongylus brasiliensis]
MTAATRNYSFYCRCHVPEPTQLTEEQLAKINEKKREKKQRQKEKLKLKKEAEKKEADELAARAAFLAMSDREKRAAAAEARLARLDGGPRCIQCGVAYAGSGFEYMELKFCSPSCVSLHRRGTALSDAKLFAKTFTQAGFEPGVWEFPGSCAILQMFYSIML